jgi:hypothetical protein
MGILLRVLTLPVTGPFEGALWVAQQIADAAEQELYDEKRIRAALLDLELRHDLGEINTAAFEAAEEELLERLQIARERRTAADTQGDTP